jgi:hypothetical protein
LWVFNPGDFQVLLIDGDVLPCAKQNRALNTSILFKELSEKRVPVSCTEQGRWSYASASYAESANAMAFKSLVLKSRQFPVISITSENLSAAWTVFVRAFLAPLLHHV